MFNPHTVPLAVYVSGHSPIHRAPTGAKLGVVVVTIFLTAIFGGHRPVAISGLLVMLALYSMARIPPAIAAKQLLGPLPVVLFISATTWWREDLGTALNTAATLITAIGIAILLTLTTTIEHMMDALEAGLNPLTDRGFPTEKILIAFSLTMRLIPLTALTVSEILEARRARGLGLSPSAFGVPLIVRSLLRAKALGEALISRGL